MIGRRGFLIGMSALIAAPAIVRVTSIMPIKAFDVTNTDLWLTQWLDEMHYQTFGRSPMMDALPSMHKLSLLRTKDPSLVVQPIDTSAIWRGMPGGLL